MTNELFERELQNTSINGVSLADYINENYIVKKTGHWTLYHEGCFDESYVCSKCDGDSPFDYKYCPNCGAKMQEVEANV